MAEVISIKGVLVTLVHLQGDKWIAEWIGSNGKKAHVIRKSRQAAIDEVAPMMKLRSRVLGVEF